MPQRQCFDLSEFRRSLRDGTLPLLVEANPGLSSPAGISDREWGEYMQLMFAAMTGKSFGVWAVDRHGRVYRQRSAAT